MRAGVRLGAAVLLAACLAALGGCADYQGLDELSIVSGLTLDISRQSPDRLALTFEIIDTAASRDKGGKKTKIVEAEGATILEAISAANRQLSDDLYFGNAELLVVQEKLLRQRGLSYVIEPFIRDYWVRDTLLIVVSREATAKEILEASAQSDQILSYEITMALDWQKRDSRSTHALQLYEVYDELKRDTDSIALPAIRLKDEAPYLDGLAVFDKSLLAGFLEAEDVMYFMLMHEELNSGVFAFYLDDDPQKAITLQLYSSSPSLGWRRQEEALVLTAHISLKAGLHSALPAVGHIDKQRLEDIKAQAGRRLEQRMLDTMHTIQTGPGTDIYGFGKTIFRQSPTLWRSLKGGWPSTFANAAVEISVAFDIDRTGLLLDY